MRTRQTRGAVMDWERELEFLKELESKSVLRNALGLCDALDVIIKDHPEVARYLPGLPAVRERIEKAIAAPELKKLTVELLREALREQDATFVEPGSLSNLVDTINEKLEDRRGI